MKKLFIFLIGLFMMCSLNSCDVYSYATTQDDIYVEAQADVVRSDVDFNIVIRHGTPYYYNGAVLYYVYNGLYDCIRPIIVSIVSLEDLIFLYLFSH